LRYFLGCTSEETAAVMKVSKATVDRDLKFARGWLFRHMRGDSGALDAVLRAAGERRGSGK
jgi:DNA-directed RNA polymerase specialized sigma24 family protein